MEPTNMQLPPIENLFISADGASRKPLYWDDAKMLFTQDQPPYTVAKKGNRAQDWKEVFLPVKPGTNLSRRNLKTLKLYAHDWDENLFCWTWVKSPTGEKYIVGIFPEENSYHLSGGRSMCKLFAGLKYSHSGKPGPRWGWPFAWEYTKVEAGGPSLQAPPCPFEAEESLNEHMDLDQDDTEAPPPNAETKLSLLEIHGFDTLGRELHGFDALGRRTTDVKTDTPEAMHHAAKAFFNWHNDSERSEELNKNSIRFKDTQSLDNSMVTALMESKERVLPDTTIYLALPENALSSATDPEDPTDGMNLILSQYQLENTALRFFHCKDSLFMPKQHPDLVKLSDVINSNCDINNFLDAVIMWTRDLPEHNSLPRHSILDRVYIKYPRISSPLCEDWTEMLIKRSKPESLERFLRGVGKAPVWQQEMNKAEWVIDMMPEYNEEYVERKRVEEAPRKQNEETERKELVHFHGSVEEMEGDCEGEEGSANPILRLTL